MLWREFEVTFGDYWIHGFKYLVFNLLFSILRALQISTYMYFMMKDQIYSTWKIPDSYYTNSKLVLYFIIHCLSSATLKFSQPVANLVLTFSCYMGVRKFCLLQGHMLAMVWQFSLHVSREIFYFFHFFHNITRPFVCQWYFWGY